MDQQFSARDSCLPQNRPMINSQNAKSAVSQQRASSTDEEGLDFAFMFLGCDSIKRDSGQAPPENLGKTWAKNSIFLRGFLLCPWAKDSRINWVYHR
jgi:hypothetical protein